MTLSSKVKMQWQQVLGITLFWILCGALLSIYKCVTFDRTAEAFIYYVPWGLPFWDYLLVNIIGPAIGGLIGGSILVFYLNGRLKTKSYLHFQLVSVSFFFVIILLLNSVISFIFYYQQEILGSDTPILAALQVLFDPYAIRNILTWMLIAFFTLHGLRVSERYGVATYLRLLLGAFHTPREVNRIFMFLDLSDATTIAERLGHRKFFELLQEFYADITDPILNARGHIYQYVGDEIIISWALPRRRDKAINYMDCFFAIEDLIQGKSAGYRQRYGLVPVFKAAMHHGSVVVGEMGVAKREIVYSGDIMNTTARILEQCKRHEQKLIISEDLIAISQKTTLDSISLKPLGNLILRGKKRAIGLYGVEKKETSPLLNVLEPGEMTPESTVLRPDVKNA